MILVLVEVARNTRNVVENNKSIKVANITIHNVINKMIQMIYLAVNLIVQMC